MEKFKRMFDIIYDKKEDKKIIEFILNEVKKYDVYDFLLKLSALNLIPENQNKSVIIDPIIAAILTLIREECISTQKIKYNEFCKIVSLMNKMDISKAIDPPERPFIERVMFFDNYSIFNGINYNPGYILQELIKTIFVENINFSDKFTNKSTILIKFILETSNYICKKMNFKIEKLDQISEEKNIMIPTSSELEKMIKILLVDEKIINKALKNDNELISLLYSEFEYEKLDNILNTENQNFFSKPFIKDISGNVIILSPSILAPFLINKLIILAEVYNEKSLLINSYNKLIWKNIRKHFDRLGNMKIKEDFFEIKLEDNENYKEILLSGDNKQVFITVGIFDDGRNYKFDKCFDMYTIPNLNLKIQNRINRIINKLKKNKIKEKDIFICFLFGSLGRGIQLSLDIDTCNKPIFLSAFELKCISINEINQRFFLSRYIKSKSKLVETLHQFGELPYIDIYTSKNNSFYISDEFNPRKNFLLLSGGDYVTYILKALKKENRHLVNSIDENYMKEVILQDEKRKIYTPSFFHKEKIYLELLNEFKNLNIWTFSSEITSSEELEVYKSIIDCISYWLGEAKEIIESNKINYEQINIKIELCGNIDEYFQYKDEEINIVNTIEILVQNNEILIKITPATYRLFSKDTNINEKIFIKEIIKKIVHLNKGNLKKLDRIFFPLEKQKFFSLDYQKYPYFKPVSSRKNRRINENDINEILDELGEYILSLGKWQYGIVKDEDRKEISDLVVNYLYQKLEEMIKAYNAQGIIEIIYSDLEECVYDMLLFQKRQYYDILCYPEKNNEVWENFNKNQRVSRALKFLCEYIAAKPPVGEEILGETEYEYLIALCSLIIEWAYNNDLFLYKMFSTPIEILKSDRIGLKRDEYEILGKSMLNARMNEFNYNSIKKWDEIIVKPKIIFEELDKAFCIENGFSYSELFRICMELIYIGDEQNTEVKKYNYEAIIKRIEDTVKDIGNEKIVQIINYISLKERIDYLTPPEGFTKIDIFPWRFNRNLSFTRRPVIFRKDEIIWGNRSVFHMLMFTLDIIELGKMKAKSKQMIKYLGEMNKIRGKAFNDTIYNILKSYNKLKVEKNLNKINKKKIMDEDNKDLGDIDVMYIYEDKRIIVVGETKDFKLSKSPYEIYNEHLNMFVDKENKKSFSTKLKRRAEWIEKHIEDVKQHFNLEGENWKVYRIFIINEHLISKDVFSINENIISMSEISFEKLINLNQ